MPRARYASDGMANSAHLLSLHERVFVSLGEIDRIGHQAPESAIAGYDGRPWETTLGLALLRRSIAQFEGVRYLLERAAVQSATLPARAHFETLLAARYFLYGARPSVGPTTPSTSRGREVRARYYRTEEVRREIYRRQALLDGRFGGRRPDRATRDGVKEEIDDRVQWLNRFKPAQQKAFGPLLCYSSAATRRQHHDRYPWYAYGFARRHRDRVRTVRGLASRFGWLRDYEMLYDASSGFVHVRGLRHDTCQETRTSTQSGDTNFYAPA